MLCRNIDPECDMLSQVCVAFSLEVQQRVRPPFVTFHLVPNILLHRNVPHKRNSDRIALPPGRPRIRCPPKARTASSGRPDRPDVPLHPVQLSRFDLRMVTPVA